MLDCGGTRDFAADEQAIAAARSPSRSGAITGVFIMQILYLNFRYITA